MGQWDDNRYVAQMKKEFSQSLEKDKVKSKSKMTAEIFKLMQEAISQGKGEKVMDRMNDYTMTKVQEEKLTKSIHDFGAKEKQQQKEQ